MTQIDLLYHISELQKYEHKHSCSINTKGSYVTSLILLFRSVVLGKSLLLVHVRLIVIHNDLSLTLSSLQVNDSQIISSPVKPHHQESNTLSLSLK